MWNMLDSESKEEAVVADDWKTEFSIEDDEFAYATVTHNGVTQKHKLGPAGIVVAEAMGWVEYNDVREFLPDQSFRDFADFLEFERDRPDWANELRAMADELYGKEEDLPAFDFTAEARTVQ